MCSVKCACVHKENDSENFQGAGAEKGLHRSAFTKAAFRFCGVYAGKSGGSPQLDSRNARMVFMAYDLISYEYRNEPFKRRLENSKICTKPRVLTESGEANQSISLAECVLLNNASFESCGHQNSTEKLEPIKEVSKNLSIFCPTAGKEA